MVNSQHSPTHAENQAAMHADKLSKGLLVGSLDEFFQVLRALGNTLNLHSRIGLKFLLISGLHDWTQFKTLPVVPRATPHPGRKESLPTMLVNGCGEFIVFISHPFSLF